VLRLLKPSFAIVAIVGLVAAGCGGSSKGTPTAPPVSDPDEIITRSVTASQNITSLHIRVNVGGKVNLSSLSGGSAGGGLGGSIDLAGTYAEGDIDASKKDTQDVKADLKFGMPGLLALSGRIIVVDGYMYTQVSLQGDKYSKSKLDTALPVSVPSADPSATLAIASQVDELRKSLKDAGATTSLKGDEKVDGKDCYHVAIDVPASKLNELLGTAGVASASMAIESTQVDYYVYKDSLLPAKVFLGANVTGVGNLTLEAIITKYGESVSVKAPDASQIQEATPAA